ncbi:MAG: hypothetical protein GX606_00775 [Elusimicrobia bacterium]|nr:hypothetical protein [Elusimicrobiota bacterium]
MIRLFRNKNVRRNVLWLISGLIILSFALSAGITGYNNSASGPSVAGRAFGRKVSMKEFRKNALATRDQIILMYGENARRILPYMDLNGETWKNFLLLKEADRLKIVASDAEVISAIQSIPAFQKRGMFDQATYERTLKILFGREPHSFEEGIRNQIRVLKLITNRTSGIRLSEEKIRQEYEKRHQKVRVHYSLIPNSRFTEPGTPTDQEIASYYEAHKQDFLTPDAVKAGYLLFPLKEDAEKEAIDKALAQASELRQKIQSGADMTAIAKENALAYRETGFFSMEEPALELAWPLELLRAVFYAKKGDVLEPAKTPQGIQLLKIIDVRPAYIPELTAVKDKVQGRMAENKAAELAKAKANETLSAVKKAMGEGQTFEQALKALGETVGTTPFFSVGDYIPEIGISDDFQNAAIALRPESPLSDVIMTAKGAAMLHAADREPIDEKKFEADKEAFTKGLYEEERGRILGELLQEIRVRSGLEDYLTGQPGN